MNLFLFGIFGFIFCFLGIVLVRSYRISIKENKNDLINHDRFFLHDKKMLIVGVGTIFTGAAILALLLIGSIIN